MVASAESPGLWGVVSLRVSWICVTPNSTHMDCQVGLEAKFLCWIGIPEKLASHRCEKFGKQVYFQGFQRAGLQKQGKYYLST